MSSVNHSVLAFRHRGKLPPLGVSFAPQFSPCPYSSGLSLVSFKTTMKSPKRIATNIFPYIITSSNQDRGSWPASPTGDTFQFCFFRHKLLHITPLLSRKRKYKSSHTRSIFSGLSFSLRRLKNHLSTGQAILFSNYLTLTMHHCSKNFTNISSILTTLL